MQPYWFAEKKKKAPSYPCRMWYLGEKFALRRTSWKYNKQKCLWQKLKWKFCKIGRSTNTFYNNSMQYISSLYCINRSLTVQPTLWLYVLKSRCLDFRIKFHRKSSVWILWSSLPHLQIWFMDALFRPDWWGIQSGHICLSRAPRRALIVSLWWWLSPSIRLLNSIMFFRFHSHLLKWGKWGHIWL